MESQDSSRDSSHLVKSDEIAELRQELLDYIENNSNARLGTRVHSQFFMDFFEKTVKTLVAAEDTVCSHSLDMEMLYEVNKKIDLLLNRQVETRPPVPTYAEKASGIPHKETVRHLVFVSSLSEKENAEKLKQSVQKGINPKHLKVGVRNVRKLRNNALIIEVGNKNEVETLTNELNKMEEIRA